MKLVKRFQFRKDPYYDIAQGETETLIADVSYCGESHESQG